ncbi:hypothetical protein VVR26_08805 [Corynebacterium camporealensis]|uniref:hypothetical protein n=1 Tax=Corynebacterium camporealensis TaxID=161896 RepID=UPI0034CFF795
MKIKALVCGAVAASLLSACGSEEPTGPQAPGDERIVGKDWQVVGIYTNPDSPSTIPDSLVEVPHISFGESSAVGTTGCTRFTAEVSFSTGEDSTNIRDADVMHLDEITYDEPSESCTGAANWADTSMRHLLREGNDFDISMNPNNQLVLTLDTDEVDSPALRLVSL